MSPASGARGKSSQPQINVTPLIDVVLVVLIMLMMIAPSLARKMDFELPKQVLVQESDNTSEPQLVLTVGPEGALHLNDEPIDQDSLETRLRLVFKNRREKTVFFDVDDQIQYGDVVHLMDVCRAAGATALGLADPTPRPEPSFEAR
ncbi:MAG: biopolymer transporter ExbD [Deltaproteobacteria bacterium]|nr:biopolymer transporter ExbD [Deltaproteobacteria bacterium]